MGGFTSIPFKTESESGMTSVNGIAKFSAAGVVIEFEPKILGLISVGMKEVRLSVSDILDVNFKKGVLKRGAKIEIRSNSLANISELPHSEGKITLRLLPKDFERARDAVAKLQVKMNT